ncbi:MAG TPA: ABC transporter ATP-binding protein [Acidimicrobiia bacterium]
MLELNGVHFAYGDLTVLAGLDLTIGADERVALIGRSGSGKTTILRIVAGLLAPSRGAVVWDGEDLGGVPPHRRDFGLVFQDFALFPHLDVGRNVAFGLRMRHLPLAEIESRVSKALEQVDLAGYERRRVSELSGGQAQRVALARTLATGPRLLLLDEPLGSIDPALRRGLATDLAATLDTAGVPAIIVTHAIDDAFVLGDRVALLAEGLIVREGTPERVWEVPGTEAAARLLGLGDPVDVTVGRDGVRLGLHDGRLAHAVIRPERVSIAPDGDTEGVVVASVFRGPGYDVTVETAHGIVTARTPSPIPGGQTVRLHLPSEAFTLLDG